MFSFIDSLLDRITMYRLLLYYLIILVLVAMGFSAVGILHFSAVAIGISTLILVITCYVVNKFFAFVFHVPTNVDSTHITALIMALIIAPMANYSLETVGFLLAASGLAMASKYILTINKKHIFNPAAIAVALTALGPHQSASWWVGTKVLLPFVVLGGILLVRKIRRGRMVLTFFISALLATILYTLLAKGSVATTLDKTVLTSAMFFLGFVMLTEPLTTPPTGGKQAWYAVLAGVLFPPQFHILSLYSTPELTLVASNIFSYVISPKTKLFPILSERLRLTPNTIDFVFNPGQKFSYAPGQYMEWTLPHEGADSRGNRRSFTLASSPTENEVRIGVKFSNRGSSYKRAMLKLTPDTQIIAGQVSGDFVLPKDPARKLVFIAGGIGITPYRSMIKYLLDTKEIRPITLLYSARTPQSFAYKGVFEQARSQIGVNTIYAVTSKETALTSQYDHAGRITEKMIRSEVPDYMDRLFYISGTQAMVTDMKAVLASLGVPRRQIKVDYFSGYA